ncbi:hypothetical protein PCASD_03112 [Puccinia coronata f. sp. avenae]|uniref:Uncharacterized protein n=1 Tax=Puccinia coronata f. sp. avenae TaxID=200324 RepID=A0A2N5V5T1_9BASI|nr:hypothetical protein PCASD_03112 [Puccinia coronata f. sp. avenae]
MRQPIQRLPEPQRLASNGSPSTAPHGSDQCACQTVGQPRPISFQLPGWLATGWTALMGQACPTGWQDYWLDPPAQSPVKHGG